MKKSLSLFVASLVSVLHAPSSGWADVQLPKVISSHMVLQRDQPLPIWGWADPGEEVTVKLDETIAIARTDAQGNWKVVLCAVKADGRAHRMTVSGKNKIELDDILIGEVWLGSGQSNMAMALVDAEGGKEAVAIAANLKIRLLNVPTVQAAQPAKDMGNGDARNTKMQPGSATQHEPAWKPCEPRTVQSFSAVLYFFGRRLQKDLDVPVGLINSPWAGSFIEPWIVAGEKGGGMYNGMIAPLKPFALRGALWYQGEGNVFKLDRLKYAGKMKALIEGWRQAWGNDFPFYFVQLPPCRGYPSGELPYLWEAQVASLKIPGTGMVVTTDVGDKTIHPKSKFDVGNRLALLALARTYGKSDVVYSGPLYKGMKVEGNKIRLSFAHASSGLKSRDGKPLAEFQVAGADGKFFPAQAAIDGATILVESKEVILPTQVRFGWHNMASPNLVNMVGLPASPFQTSEWQGGTGE